MMSPDNETAVANRHIVFRGIDQLCNSCSIFGSCDCISSTYLGVAISFFFFGTLMMFNGESDDFLSKFELRPACLIGFIFISTSLAAAMKSLLYLRRKNVLILLRNRHPVSMSLRLSIPDATTSFQRAGPSEDSPSKEYVVRTASATTLPPAYDETVNQGIETGEDSLSFAPADTAPPSYDEALNLMSVRSSMEAEAEKPLSAAVVNLP